MPHGHIQPNRRYIHCHPHENTMIVVREYDGGDRVKVADPRGKHVRWIDAKMLRPSATKPNGEPYKSGYAPAAPNA